MVEKKKVSAHPPLIETKNKEMDFINGEAASPKTLAEQKKYPWEKDGVRSNVMKTFNVRLSEPEFLKLKYLSEQKRQSMNSICVSLMQKLFQDEID